MSNYSPDTKIYYGPKDVDHRLVPAPDVTISVEMDYSNDSIIGYKYILTLTGVATALDLRSLNYGDSIPPSGNYGIGAVTDHIHKIRNILSQNGNILHIVHGDDDSPILKAKGGILRSLTFDESSNNWYHFANYTATLEFNSIDLFSYTEDCSNIFLDPSTYAANDSGIVNISKFKIKTFSDSWKITFDETEAFNKIKQIEIQNINNNLNINNTGFNIEYTISATGKHHYVYTDEETGESELLPAWEQAKNFVQYRLHSQVTALLNNVLKNYDSTCSSTDNLSTINTPGSTGLYSGLGDANYGIYNEQITCESSESDGTFSATYSAVVKSKLGNQSWSLPGAKHTVSKTINTTRSGGSTNTTTTINGTIEGLVEGGLIKSPKQIELPSSGSLFIYTGSSDSKYDNAITVLNKIYDPNEYNGGIGATGKRDLKIAFKSVLGIILQSQDCSISEIPDPPHPTSFNLTHDYNQGIITYTVEYNSIGYSIRGRKYRDISIETIKPTKIIAVFNIPNSNSCPIVQELGTYTAQRVNITIQGVDLTDTGQPETVNLSNELQCGGCINNMYLPIELPNSANSILTQQQYTKNPADGSFTINLSYICGTAGCTI